MLDGYVHAVAQVAETESSIATSFLWIAMVLLAARLSRLVERFGQPGVLGELLVGVVLGNLGLLGIGVFEPVRSDALLAFLAQLGIVILLFQIGLESDVQAMIQVGLRASLVASVGVIVPFMLGAYVFGPWLLPGLGFEAYLFVGAALTATSVGITARVFRDLGKLQSTEAQIVLGAAVIDDVLGLIVLAVVSAIVTAGFVSLGTVGWIVLKAVVFLVAVIVLGRVLARHIGQLFSRVHNGISAKFTLAISFGLVFAYLAELFGLAPILGAFGAGLALDPVHFRYFKDPRVVDVVRGSLADAEPAVRERVLRVIEPYSHRHIEDLIEPLGYFFVPIFFVVTGAALRLETLFDLSMVLVALGVTCVALAGKIASGVAAGRANKWIVGWGMVPRGEVGLIFAAVGRSLGVISDDVFSVIVVMVILTTFVTPPVLAYLLKRNGRTVDAASRPGPGGR
ncbi:MAG: cation:proton antiporter [Chloroflexi bacterium]|nr:cation:proton antiporter [Chloroflexota bacterium]